MQYANFVLERRPLQYQNGDYKLATFFINEATLETSLSVPPYVGSRVSSQELTNFKLFWRDGSCLLDAKNMNLKKSNLSFLNCCSIDLLRNVFRAFLESISAAEPRSTSFWMMGRSEK